MPMAISNSTNYTAGPVGGPFGPTGGAHSDEVACVFDLSRPKASADTNYLRHRIERRLGEEVLARCDAIIQKIFDTQPCPRCGTSMPAIAGRKDAFCASCGYKEGCC
jgi:NADH pyrophosphatase NudC (nudix superfamily)